MKKGKKTKKIPIKAKKSLGQNFLKSEKALNDIIKAGNLQKGETILEIGPGKGALTEKLLKKEVKILAVEKDEDLLPLLEEKFKEDIENSRLSLIYGDVLNFDFEKYSLESCAYKIIANIPYNITGAILKKFLGGENQPRQMVLMVQKEVADRILAKNNKESVLSISVKAYGQPSHITKVSKRYFSPSPKVDSAVISINKINKNFFSENSIEEKAFWNLVKTGFSHKRKTLLNNLKNFNKKINWTEALQCLNLDLKTRPENLSLSDWKELFLYYLKCYN